MTLLHVYHGSTEDNEYYWFVCSELGDECQLFLPMPQQKVTKGIKNDFELICGVFSSERTKRPTSSPKLLLDNMAKGMNFSFHVTVPDPNS
jgi:hypothetical protein